jgi:hypothetical protein
VSSTNISNIINGKIWINGNRRSALNDISNRTTISYYDKIIRRAMSKVSFVGDCWLWSGGIEKPSGTPVIYDDRTSSMIRVWKLLWEKENGPASFRSGRAKCGSTFCVNPAHIVEV